MENNLKNCEINKLECILRCENSKAFYKFPHEEKILKMWLEKLGLNDFPRGNALPRICNNHFSEDMFDVGGRRLKQNAVPVLHIPGKKVDITSYKKLSIPYQIHPNIVQSKPKILHILDKTSTSPNPDIPISDIVKKPLNKAVDENRKQINTTSKTTIAANKYTNIIKPKLSTSTSQLMPRSVQKAEIIISRHSKCFLKCRDAKHTYQLPQDEGSRMIWVKKFGLTAMPPRTSTARLCRNHFSPRMFTIHKGYRLTSCAIPDINLPGQTIFTSEEGTVNGVYWPMGVPLRSEASPIEDISDTTELSAPALSPQPDDKMKEYFRAILDPPFDIENHPEVSQPEILINPIENIKTAINQEHNKEGVLHVFQPGVEKRIMLPDSANEGKMECVLKCTNSEHLFKFPNPEFQRKIWLDRVGLTHCYFNTMICDKHFSEQMFTKTKKRLIKTAFPDINIPKPEQLRLRDNPRRLSDYRIVLEDHVCDVIELPEFICVLTVLKEHTEVGAAINGMKYIRHNIDVNIPKREREVQVKASDLVSQVNVGISSDDAGEDFDTVENIDFQQLEWMNMFKSHMSKAEMFECLICGEISVGQDCKLKHSNVHKESSSLCFQCGRLFPNQHKLKIHERKKHLNLIRKALRCPKIHCKKAFHSKKQLHHHVEEHTKRSERKCNKCHRVFTSALKLHSHQIVCRHSWRVKYPRRVDIQIKSNYK